MESSVTFWEHEDSPKESGDRSGQFSFERIFLTAWADRNTFIREMMTGGFYGLPQSYSQDWPGLFAESWKVDRIINNPIQGTITNPASQQLSHNTLARITFTYTPIGVTEQDPGDEQLPSGTFATYDQEEEGEFLSVPSRGMIWDSDGKRLSPDIVGVIPQTTTRHVVTWHRVVNPPWATMASLINKVNSVAWRIPATGQVFQPETLLFAARSASLTLAYDSEPTWKLKLTFIEKAQKNLVSTGDGPIGGTTIYGWNHQWREDDGIYDRPVNAKSFHRMFQSADLRTLFTSST